MSTSLHEDFSWRSWRAERRALIRLFDQARNDYLRAPGAAAETTFETAGS